MNTYRIQYMLEGAWVSADIKAPSIYDALDWAQTNIQPNVAVSFFG